MSHGSRRVLLGVEVEGTVKAQQWWYYLHQSRQIGPYSQGELHSLLAKQIISPATLVWTQGGNSWRALGEILGEHPRAGNSARGWMAVALGILMFVGGSTMIATAPTGSESRSTASQANEKEQLADWISDHKHIQIAEIALSNFGRARGLAANWSDASPISAGYLFAPVADAPERPVPATRTALSEEASLELEIWRPLAKANDPELYGAYLQRYPAGSFADIAAAKIKALGNTTADAAARKAVPERKRSSAPALKTPAKASTLKAADRCWNGNIGACRQRCREGEVRACQTLKRLRG